MAIGIGEVGDPVAPVLVFGGRDDLRTSAVRPLHHGGEIIFEQVKLTPRNALASGWMGQGRSNDPSDAVLRHQAQLAATQVELRHAGNVQHRFRIEEDAVEVAAGGLGADIENEEDLHVPKIVRMPNFGRPCTSCST